MEGHGDMNLGHVSAREAGQQVVLIKPSGLGFEEVRPEDLVEIDLEGRRISGEASPPGEWPIHTEIYRARSDVNCVIHTHPLWGVVFGIVGIPFQPLNQDGVMFAARGLRVYRGSPELITTREQGAAMAAALGDANALLLPNHGVVIAASSVEEALMLALNLEKAMQVQLLAAACGGARNVIEPALAARMGQDLLNNRKRTESIFAYYRRKAGGGE
jgi:L-fuculose-phosphate aldolase